MQQIAAHMVQEVVPKRYTQCSVVSKLLRELVTVAALKPLVAYAQPAVLADTLLMHLPGTICLVSSRDELHEAATALNRAARSVGRKEAEAAHSASPPRYEVDHA
jgi:methyl coenzyme M reductase subunit C-like uncharacterized protein (methanogenesis marker protein 7)